MIDLKRLHHAHTLARYQNFAVAAETLSLSQSALTRSIQSLEEQLGVLLLFIIVISYVSIQALLPGKKIRTRTQNQ